MKKRILSLLTLLCMLMLLLPSNMITVSAYIGTKYGDYLYYTESNGEIAISDCDESATKIEIPSEIDGKKVTSIRSYAFYQCSNLTSIRIPDSVTSIGNGAFENCDHLTSINVDENNKNYCSVDGNLFNKSKTKLIQYAPGKSNVQYVLPDSVTSIGKNAFSDCNNLTNIMISDSVTSIGDYAFEDCSRLTSVTIGNNVTSIGFSAFYNCDSLTSINIPSSVTSIGDATFKECSNLTSINIPNSVTYISGYMLAGCSNLTSIDISSSVTSIGSFAFMSCGLTSISIPNSINSISYGAFCGCSSLTHIYYNGTEIDWNNIVIADENEYLTKATRTYFAYINIFDKDGNKVIDTTQNMGETVDTSSITVPDGYKLVLCKDKEMTEEYSLDTPISENLNLYYDIIEVNKLTITGTENADIGQKGITESVTFATDKTAKDFVATIKFSDKLNLSEITEKDFSITENLSETKNGYTYLYLTCTYKNDGNMPKNTTLNAFDLVFDVSESATANEKLTIEFVGDDTFLADSGNSTHDFDGFGTAEIKINPIIVKSVTINGADEIDKATQYTAVISPENATNKDIEWTVDNSEIATISADGILTPVKAGTVKITATAKDGSGIYDEKSVNVKVYAQITSLTASAGEWDKTFTPSEREYIIYVPKNTSSIKLTPTHNGTLLKGTTKCYSGRNTIITLTDKETVLTLTYSQTGYTDSEYKIKIVKFEGTKTTVSKDGKSFTIKPINIASGNTVILALYNGEKFVAMQSAVYSGTNIPFAITDDYTTAKVMVWNNSYNIMPICDVEIVNTESNR